MYLCKIKKCTLCGESDNRLLEKHHIFGKNNSPEIMLLCKNCHYKITHEQNKIAPKKRSRNATPNDLEKFMLISMGVLLQEMGKILKESGNIIIEMSKEEGVK